MTDKYKSYAFMAAGFVVMMFATWVLGETPLGWATVFAGLGVYYYGWRGVCPACQAGRCELQPPRDVVKPQNAPEG